MSILFIHLKKLVIFSLGLILFSTISVFAGTPAQTIGDVNLREGPGVRYTISSNIIAHENVIVERCQKRWCLISNRSTKGWVSIDDLSFGVNPIRAYSGARHEQIFQGDGEVCFYTGANFSGEAICSKTGVVVKDLALYGRDNSFASISIEGEISAMVCRDLDFSSYCETITKDQPSLSRFLKRAISSYRVW